jgi:multidrug efflux pump subunit AcrA (membrane-fusion protein)
MTKRRVFIILGMVLIALGSWGVIYSQLDLSRQRETAKAKAAEEQRMAEEERTKAEELSRLAELEKQKNNELEIKRAEEDRLREEAARRRLESEEKMRRRSSQRKGEREPEEGISKSQSRIAKAEPRQGARPPDSQPDRLERSALNRSQGRSTADEFEGRSQRPTVIRFTFDPRRDKEIPAAHVHVGDVVSIRIRGLEGTEPPLYVGLAPVRMAANSRAPKETDLSRLRPAIATRVDEQDQFKISVPPSLDRTSARIMESRAGAALSVSTGFGSKRRSPRGAYEVEIEIENGNPWNIKPRSLLR